jgi:acyl dehydratase
MRTFDDFTVGEEIEFGRAAFELGEMIAFAERWDPQLFHTDPEAAAETAFGGLIASGWQTLAAVGRLLTDRIMEEQWANLGGTGMNGIRLVAPVRPGDVLTVRGSVIALEPSQSGQPRGRLDFRVDFANQNGQHVGEMTLSLLLARPSA